MSPDILAPLGLSLRVSVAATLLVVPPGLLAAWGLARLGKFPGRTLVETLLTLPLVLPPTVVGYLLLLLFGRGTAWGRWLNDAVHLRLLFTWQGAAIASAVMAFPLFVRTAASALASVDQELLEMGRTLGARERDLLWHVLIPQAYRGLLAALTLAFARALGEFGATIMIAGSIPGRTQTLPLALYDAWQNDDHDMALTTLLLLTLLAFLLLVTVNTWQNRYAGRR